MIHNNRKIKDFAESEFPKNVHIYAGLHLLPKMQDQRDINRAKMWPSKNKDGFARLKLIGMSINDYRAEHEHEPSMHEVFYDRQCQAIDWFSELSPFETFVKVLGSGLWSGIGVYPDVRNNDGDLDTMFHTDYGRPKTLLWFREKGIYTYQGERGFYSGLNRILG